MTCQCTGHEGSRGYQGLLGSKVISWSFLTEVLLNFIVKGMLNLSYCTADQGLPGRRGNSGYPGEEGGHVSCGVKIY